MPEKWRQFGAGPKWGLVTMVYFAIAVIVHYATCPRFVITWLSASSCVIIGTSLLIMGVCMYATAFANLRRGLRKGILVTQGLYAIMRHPLYASSIFFIIPGLALVFRSWLLLPMPTIAYIAFRIFLPAEERNLSDQYGEDFKLYRERTNAVFPVLRRRRKKQ